MLDKKCRRPLSELGTDELIELLNNPENCHDLPDEELDQFIYFAIGLYGATPRPEFIIKLLTIYDYFLRRIPPTQRLRNYCAIREQVMSDEIGVNGLLPYLFADDDIGIVSTAALDFAVLRPLIDDDPLTGPKSLLKLIDEGRLSNPAAVFGGMVMLGDQRVMNLLKRTKHRLTKPEVETVIKCISGYLLSATVEFYLDWLEDLKGDCDDAMFGVIAAALCNLIRRASEPVVRSIERVFPIKHGNAIRVLEVWSLKDYAKKVMPRLQAIARREKGPAIMPQVIEMWSAV